MAAKFGVKNIPTPMRPREKLADLGATRLTDRELIMILLGSGNGQASVIKTTERLIGRFKNLKRLSQASLEDIVAIKGIGPARATQIKAAIEISRRISSDVRNPEPFIKWVGGKNQLLSQFAPLFPEPQAYERYIEPFLGGGAVYFHLRPQKAILMDLNTDLIETYRSVRDSAEDLITQLEQHQSRHSKDWFDGLRTKYNERSIREVQRAAAFIYLNKTCFNGLYRVNSRGEFNVPYGKHKNPSVFDAANLLAVSKLLKTADLKSSSYEDVLEVAKRGDFVYFDPPYFPLNATSSFTSYTKEDFNATDQKRLAEIFRVLDRRGCKLMLSNSDTAFIRDLYKGFRLEVVQATRFINCDGAKRGAINEVVVLNY